MYQFPHPDELLNSTAELLAFAKISIDQSRQMEQAALGSLSAALRAESIQPVRVTRHFARRIEPGNPRDPLLTQTLPTAYELLSPPNYTRNPLKEQYRGRNLLAKYSGRVLLIASNACAGACRFCFRRFTVKNNEESATWANCQNDDSVPQTRGNLGSRQEQTTKSQIPHLLDALEYIKNDPDVAEVILSGGDPLMLDNAQLRELFNRLAEIAHVKRIRVHSRMTIYYPPRFDDELLNLFSAVVQKKKGLIFVSHVNHANEIDEEVVEAFDRLRKVGAILLQQGTLLKGVNDSADALCALYEKLIDCSVIPYYLHVLDHVAGAAHFLVDDNAAIELIKEIRNRLPGYAVPRLAREIPGEGSKTILE